MNSKPLWRKLTPTAVYPSCMSRFIAVRTNWEPWVPGENGMSAIGVKGSSRNIRNWVFEDVNPGSQRDGKHQPSVACAT